MVAYTQKKRKGIQTGKEKRNKKGNEDQIKIKQREREQHIICFETFAIRITDDAGLT